MINYNIIAKSIDFYEERDFVQIESPWVVSKQTSAITKPEFCVDYELKHNGKVLVGSGEQSFLYLYLKGFLPKGKFQTVTPCFRDESFDFLHSKYFIKNELIVTDDVSEAVLYDVVKFCQSFFSRYLESKNVHTVTTEEGVDLIYKHNQKSYELGSYGIRECEYLKWIYATGVAEPRLSRIINLCDGLSQEKNTEG